MDLQQIQQLGTTLAAIGALGFSFVNYLQSRRTFRETRVASPLYAFERLRFSAYHSAFR